MTARPFMLDEDQLDLVLKALRRQAQRHRETGEPGGSQYDEVCDALHAQMRGEWTPDEWAPEEIDLGLRGYDERRAMEAMPAPGFGAQGSGRRPPSPFEAAHMERMPNAYAYDNSEYQWYVVVRSRASALNKVESGWEYKEDANDHKREFSNAGISAGVYSRKYLRQIGLDPSMAASWAEMSDLPGGWGEPSIEYMSATRDVYADYDDATDSYPGGPNGPAGSLTVQTLLLDKDTFDRKAAVSWAKSHKFKAAKVDSTEHFWRIRQADPGDFRKETFRTIDFRPGVKAVVAVPR